MEILYLLFSIISTSLTSSFYSLLLLFRRILNPRAAEYKHVTLYQGTVWHERRRPVHHSFQYSVRYSLIDLDHSTGVPPNHFSADEARRLSKTNGPVLLLTIPPSVGYEQNPLCVYYCYDVEGSSTRNLKKCIAEVTNTPWGERVSFLFDPKYDIVAKPLHVSPFMDMFGNWSIKVTAPEDNLSVAISVEHPELGDYFTAVLRAKKVSFEMAGDQALFFWLMPHRVAIWIYWHAVKLWWKGVPFIKHPRYQSPTYREEALLRDERLQCCPSHWWDKDSNQQTETSDSSNVTEMRGKSRYYTWRDAKWPWC
ncbi:hypothetical protein ACH5RR_012961 [Cinchona calisaya]|uniref:DUF1365 domain-containing protein n=1 Tax=Cinchona calisaya TaxID=153742 RepID=A0ABD2ZYS9_9GENT